MLMMLPSAMNVVVWLICGNSLSWLLNLNLTFETLEVKWPADFNARKMQLASFDHSNNSRTV